MAAPGAADYTNIGAGRRCRAASSEHRVNTRDVNTAENTAEWAASMSDRARYGEIRGDTGRYGEIRGDTGRYGEIFRV